MYSTNIQLHIYRVDWDSAIRSVCMADIHVFHQISGDVKAFGRISTSEVRSKKQSVFLAQKTGNKAFLADAPAAQLVYHMYKYT